MQIETLPVGDNYIYVLIEGGRAAVVDPGAAAPVQALLDERRLVLELIFITHYHGDHTGGVARLRQTGCRVVGPAGGQISVDQVVVDGDTVDFAGSTVSVLEVPGHTVCDVAYHLPSEQAVFTGDTLFAAGCGRMFSGNAEQMWLSLCRLRALPGETRLFGGHDYLRDNLEFAADLEPSHVGVQARLERCKRGGPPSDTTLAEEMQTNPFLRCDSEAIATAVGLSGRTATEVFAALRQRKDRW